VCVIVCVLSPLAWFGRREIIASFAQVPTNVEAPGGRFDAWKATATMIGDAPLAGWGLGTFENGLYLLAAVFGNVHGVYKPGAVKLDPSILREGQTAVAERFGDDSMHYLVFHGGSGSTIEEIHETLQYGVVKMNIDTDCQYAYTRPIVDHMLKAYDGVLKVDGEVGDKKAYDPRAYMKKAENGMAARVSEAATQLLSAGKTIG